MANTLLTLDLVAREALMLLRSTLVGSRLFDRRYEASFTGDEAVGDTIRVRRRGVGTVREFSSSITVDDITETKVDLTLEKHYDVSFAVTSKQWTLDLQNFSEQLLAPNVLALAEQVDAYALTKMKDLPNVGGPSESSPAALPTTVAHLAAIDRKLNDQKVPMGDRVQLVSPTYKEALLSIDSFVEADKRGDGGTAIEGARMGRLMAMNHFMDQNVPTATHTSGTQTSAVVNGAVAAGATSIVYDGAAVATGTLKEGDIITIAGYGNAVIAADSAAVSNAGTLTIKEPVKNGGIADDAAITVYDGGGNTRKLQGAAFHPRAFAMASVPLAIPMEAEGAIAEYEGLAIRVIRDYDINAKKSIISLDCLVGATLIDGALGCQVIQNIA